MTRSISWAFKRHEREDRRDGIMKLGNCRDAIMSDAHTAQARTNLNLISNLANQPVKIVYGMGSTVAHAIYQDE